MRRPTHQTAESFSFHGLHLHRLAAVCDSRNQAARELLLKARLRLKGEFVKNRLVNKEWINTISFGLLKEEFDAWSKPKALKGE